MNRRLTGLWREGDFVRLWAAQTVSLFGSGMGALPFTAILFLQATPFQMAVLTAAGAVPGLAVGLVAGVWVDRLRRRPLLIAADLGRASLLLSIPLAAWFDWLRIEQLYLVGLLTGGLTVLFDVASLAYLPSLVRREALVEANSKMAASASAAEFGAFSIGGWLVQWFGALTAIVIDALTFLGSAVCLAAIRRREPPPARAAASTGVGREMIEGIGAVWREPLLRALAGSAVARELSSGMIGAVILLYGTRGLGLGPGVLGLIFGVGGLTSLLGALAAGRLTRRFGAGPTLIAALLVTVAGTLLIPLARGPALVAALFLLASQLVVDPAWSIADITETSLRQAVTPDRLLGRVHAALRVAGIAALLTGALLAGVLGEAAGLRATLVVGVGVRLLGVVALALSPVRRLTAGSAPPPA